MTPDLISNLKIRYVLTTSSTIENTIKYADTRSQSSLLPVTKIALNPITNAKNSKTIAPTNIKTDNNLNPKIPKVERAR